MLVQTGIGVQNAKMACREIFADGECDLAVSSGFAGALIPSCIGALVIPKRVVSGVRDSRERSAFSSFPCSVDYHQILSRLVQDRKPQLVMQDLLVTVPKIVCSVLEKRSLAKQFQASALDMESAGIAAVAKEHDIPFLVIRTVSDLMDETLPEAFNLFLSSSTWRQGVWRMMHTFSHWSEVYRLRQQTKVASRQLTIFFDLFICHLRDAVEMPSIRTL